MSAQLDQLLLEEYELEQKELKYMLENRLEFYDPYPFQVKFHNDISRRKGLRSGNQQGKTRCGCSQDAMDLTGLYPDWYEGHRFERPITIICGSVNNDKTRDLLQKALCGDPVDKETSLGSGWIPKKCLDYKKTSLKRGVTDAFIHVKVKHFTNGIFDGWSNLTFSSYESGKEAWMGDTIDIYHLDEEAPLDILGQAGRGCIASKGFIRLTWTPENGRTEVVRKVEEEWSLHTATLADAAGEEFDYTFEDGETIHFSPIKSQNGNTGHIIKETLDFMEKDNPGYLMKMRVKGLPVAGSGLVFHHQENHIKIDPIPIPEHWEFLDTIDFGGSASTSHPTAFCRQAYDRLTDTIYIYDGFRVKGKEIPEIAAMIISKPNSDIIPVVWPHDGNKTLGQGGPTKEQYASCGVNMFFNDQCPEKSHFTNPPEEDKKEGSGGIQIIPGITEMSARLKDGRLKVFSLVNDFFDEYRDYHWKDGKIVDENDDFMSATRYGVQSIRHFVTLERKHRNLNTIPTGSWLG